jgi:betaine-aldehyde dehydrogenase
MIKATKAQAAPEIDFVLGRMLIGGKLVDATAGRTITIENPARGTALGTVPQADEADVDRAVRDSAVAFTTWRRLTPGDRGRRLLDIADELVGHVEEIARLISRETGNAIRTQSRPEASKAVDILRYFGGVAPEIRGATIPLGEGLLSYTRREPIGVVGGIIPWNAPVTLATLKIASALSTGNTLVLKPAKEAPLAVLRVAEICQAHLPPGVLNVVTGTGPECGAALANHPLVMKLSFTGSTEIGKEMIRAAAGKVASLSLELGGKSPTIVFEDSDRNEVAAGVVSAMRFTRQGQSCSAGSRLFVHESIYDSFLARVASIVKGLRIGDPLDEATDVGSLISKQQFESVCAYIEDGLARGARPIIGGLPAATKNQSQGYFIGPTILADVDNSWRVAREEIFGPVLVAIPWKDEKDAVRMANESHYGLAAYIWCRDISRALRTAHEIESGWVQVNRGGSQLPGMSYGGFKESGWGREFSLEGAIESYTQVKNVTVDLSF